MRQQIYGGQEADCRMTHEAREEQLLLGNEIAEGEYVKHMRMGFELGEGYGHQVVAEVYNRMIQEAMQHGVDYHWAVKRAQSAMTRASFGIGPEGKKAA